MTKPFASSADIAEKTDTLDIIADGVYALTAEGAPQCRCHRRRGFRRRLRSAGNAGYRTGVARKIAGAD